MDTNIRLLPDVDIEFLDAKGYRVTERAVANWIHVIVHEFALPAAYVPTVCDLLVRLPPGYPNANPDMFWTRPEVRLANGNWPDRANVRETFEGEMWQRWSRHIPPNAWRPGTDSLQTFIATIRRELGKGV